jgi:O-antigen ligase
MEEHPFVGAGYLTHDPGIQYFDNAYGKALVELGVIGFALLILFFLSALVATWGATTKAGEYEIVLPAVGVVAALSLLAAGATFDAWTFDQFFPSALILLGVGLGRSAVIFHRERLANRDGHHLAEERA